ncbi:MAG TPA: hypothetical protein VMB24_03700 [Dehalococcoidales bacterium]|nr:hypothetical protein [Dehalococcoidales bacterium]
MPQEESGLDELMALSRKFTKQKADNEAKERQRIEQGKKVQGVLHGLQELNINMALQQLKTIAAPEVIKQVTALKTGGKTEDLRKLISSMAEGLEKSLGAKKENAPLYNEIRALNILLDLYFSFH